MTSTATQQQALELKMRESFPLFLWYCWKTINLPDPTPIQRDMAETLQNPPSRRFIIQGFRGVAKSFITCAYCVWLLWRDPQLKVLVISASKARADANAKFIRQLIKSIPFLVHLVPRKGQTDTQNLFDVGPATPDISPSVKTVGITGQITGSRADVITLDDVEVPGNSSTQMARDKLSELVKEMDAVIKPTAEAMIIYLGTPQNEQSLYNTLKDRGYKTLIWPARYPKDSKQRAAYGNSLAPFVASRYDADPDNLAWKPTDPLRFHDADLTERAISYGQSGFALQFMLDTSLSDADKYPLRIKDCVVAALGLDEAPMKWEWMPSKDLVANELPNMALRGDSWYRFRSADTEIARYSRKILAIDPAGRSGQDEAAYVVLYYLNGYIYLMEAGGLIDGYSKESLAAFAEVAKKYRVHDIVLESNFGDGMFSALLQPVMEKIYPGGAQQMTDIKNKGQKEVRIADVLEPLLGSHKLVVTEHAITHDYATALSKDGTHQPHRALFHQLPRLTRERGALASDDRLDALALGCQYLIDQMSADEDKGIQEAKAQWLEDQMEGLIQCATSPRGALGNPVERSPGEHSHLSISVAWESGAEYDDY